MTQVKKNMTVNKYSLQFVQEYTVLCVSIVVKIAYPTRKNLRSDYF